MGGATAMSTRILIVALGVAWIAALAGVVWMMILGGMRPRHLLYLLTDLNPVETACVALSVISTVIGIVSLRAGERRRALIGVAGAVGWGVLGALYGVAGARSMLINMNPPIPFSVYAPNYAAALVVLLVGLTGALLGLGLLGLLRPRQV